jgi:hypothetical protein
MSATADRTDYDRERLREVLGPLVDELEAAADRADDPADVDVFRCLASFGRRDRSPHDPSRRILDRSAGHR